MVHYMYELEAERDQLKAEVGKLHEALRAATFPNKKSPLRGLRVRRGSDTVPSYLISERDYRALGGDR